ncbi:MAG: prepilin-type N-terminal cleavage/methylation domain-containing protein [Pseudomonadales bacterium]|nr:prepilin-type N-terminal cleavage/methylation domain-containing protein [Pseudomonadales bacterium]
MRSEYGFSLIELVVVMALLAIVAIGGSRFLVDATDGYASTNSRITLADQASAALAAMHRQISAALPSSVRRSDDGRCLEWLPVRSGGRYLSAPIGLQANTVVTLGLDNMVGGRLSIGHGIQTPYVLANPGAISPTVVSQTGSTTDEATLTLLSDHEFPSATTSNRVFAVDPPQSYCFSQGALWHYQDYGFLAAQPDPADLPSALPNRILLAASVHSSTSNFSIAPPNLQRNGVVRVDMTMASDDADLSLVRHISLRNAP